MTQRIVAAVLTVAALVTGCSSSVEDRAEELFRACVEQGGGTAGEIVPLVEGGRLVVVAGPVDASAELFDQCFESTNAALVGN